MFKSAAICLLVVTFLFVIIICILVISGNRQFTENKILKIYLEQCHVQLKEEQNKVNELTEHYKCDDKQLTDCQEELDKVLKEIENEELYETVVKAIRIHNGKE